jgi:tetratricopeptide (TPR) repeat protein
MHGALIALLAATMQQARVDSVRRVDRQVNDALERGQVTALERRWTARASARKSDPEAMIGLGLVRLYTFEREKAEEWFARVERDSLASPVWQGAARAYRGVSLVTRGEITRGDSVLAYGLELAKKANDPSVEVRLAVMLARVRTLRGDVAGGQALITQAESRAPPGDSLARALLLCTRATIGFQSGATEGIKLAFEGARLARQLGDYRTAAVCTQWRGMQMERGGYLSEAQAELQRSAADARRVGALDVSAYSDQFRGYVLSQLGEFGAAQQAYEASLEAARRSRETRAEGWASIGLAGIATTIGDFPRSVVLRDRAEAIFRATSDQTGLSIALQSKGFFAKRQGDIAGAAAIYREELDLLRRTGFRSQLPRVYRELATLAQANRDWAGAQRWLDEATKLAKETNAAGWEQGDLVFHLAVSALGQQQFARADSLLTEYLRAGDEGSYLLSQGWLRKAEARVGLGDLAGAEEAMSRADAAFDSWRDRLSITELKLAAFQVEQSMGSTSDRVPTLIAALARGGSRHFDAAFAFADRRRSRELADRVLQREVLLGGSNDTSILSRRRRAATKESVVQPMLDLLGDSTALFQYVGGTGGEPSVLLVLARGVRRSFELATMDSLRAPVERFASLVSAGSPASALAQRLADSVIAAGVGVLPSRVRQLIIIPDGPLYRLPFDALRLGSGWLVERFALSQVPSASLALYLASRSTAAKSGAVMAFGDPRFEPAARSSEAQSLQADFQRSGGLVRLPNSGVEARRVAAFGAPATTLLREAASEAAIKRQLPRRVAVLHFATHSLVDDRVLGRSAIALAPGEGEDGFLTAAEASALPLDADLAMLSGCRTAGGVVLAGEGVQGLTGPFLEAGARAVIATQWAIGDAQSVPFVDRLYGYIARGATVSDALQRTKIEAIRAGVPVNQWAAFTLVGDWRSRPSLKANNAAPSAWRGAVASTR